jgi:hypothetical protein
MTPSVQWKTVAGRGQRPIRFAEEQEAMGANENPSKLNPNQATADELAELPGVGQTLARRIEHARPYKQMQDLRQVAGVGPRLFEQLEARLTLEEAPPAPPGPMAVRRPAEARSTPSYLVWWLAGTAGLSVVLSVGLTLAVLIAINGTLSVARNRQVRQSSEAVATLGSNLRALESQLRTMDQRLASLEGLTGRMDQVQTDARALRLDMQSALHGVSEMQNAVQSLQTSNTELEVRADRFDAFLNGLRRLLAIDSAGNDEGAGQNP